MSSNKINKAIREAGRTSQATEHHYRCSKGHKLSILAPVGEELIEAFDCPIERCGLKSLKASSNAAEVVKE